MTALERLALRVGFTDAMFLLAGVLLRASPVAVRCEQTMILKDDLSRALGLRMPAPYEHIRSYLLQLHYDVHSTDMPGGRMSFKVLSEVEHNLSSKFQIYALDRNFIIALEAVREAEEALF